jgi:hypothetical protein
MSYRAFGAQKFYFSLAKNVLRTFFAREKKKVLALEARAWQGQAKPQW